MTLLYGTSSWSAKGWVGPFYPERTKAAEYLRHYGAVYRTVEADTTYYGVPRPAVVDGWVEKTPEDFVLSAKFPRGIVHAGEGPRPDGDKLLVPEHCGAELETFLAAMGRLGPRCGPLVLQFPYLAPDVLPDPDVFLQRLDAQLGSLPERFRYAVEVRNRDLLDETLCDLLRRHHTALVLADVRNMPHPADLAGRLDLLTADFTYIRLIGDRRATEAKTKTFDRLVLDQGARLDRWAGLLLGLRERVDLGLIYANNHFAGFGPDTIDALAERMGDQARR